MSVAKDLSGPLWIVRSSLDVPGDDAWLSPLELRVQSGLRFAPRRADWRLGRWTAKQALSRHLREPDLPKLSVLAAEDGAPQAWRGSDRLQLHVSITHRDGQAVAAIGKRPLGVDLERTTSPTPGFVQSFFSQEEQAALQLHPEPERALTLMWSAKESVLKLRRTGLRRDTKSVLIQTPSTALSARWQPLSAHDLQHQEPLIVWCRALQDAVLTLVSLHSAPPQPLDSATACA